MASCTEQQQQGGNEITASQQLSVLHRERRDNSRAAKTTNHRLHRLHSPRTLQPIQATMSRAIEQLHTHRRKQVPCPASAVGTRQSNRDAKPRTCSWNETQPRK